MCQMANPVTEWGRGREAASAQGPRKGLPRGRLVCNDVPD